jgi:hypothetical protein
VRSTGLLSALSAAALLPTVATATITFERRWQWFSQNVGHSVEQAVDGGYAVGAEDWIESTRYGIVLAKADSLGDTAWVRYIQDVDQRGGFVCRLLDGGYAVLGTSNGGGIFVRKFSAAGDSLWTYVSSWRGPVSAIIATNDTGCAIAGRMPDTLFDFGLIKLRGDGTEEWARHYHDPRVFWSWARNAAQTRDGGYIVCGDAGDYMDSYLRLARINPSGDAVWARLYAGPVGPRFAAVREMPDSGFLAVGYVFDTLTSHDALYMMRTNAAGDTLWTRQLKPTGAAAQAAAMSGTMDGGYVIAGSIDWTDSARVWLLKTDAQADTVWTSILGGPGRETGSDVEQTADGGYVIAGTSDSAGGSLLLIKTDSLGHVLVGLAEGGPPARERIGLSVSPNPASGITLIDYSLPGRSAAALKLYDVAGCQVGSWVGLRTSGLRLDVRSIPAGVYLLRLESDSGSATRKLVIE